MGVAYAGPAETELEQARVLIKNKDYSKAKMILLKLAEEGNVEAMYSLGAFYRLGVTHNKSESPEHNSAQAKNWLHKAVDANHVAAAYMLGLMYFSESRRVKFRPEYKKACELWNKIKEEYDGAKSIYEAACKK